jgi:hypothetical protein
MKKIFLSLMLALSVLCVEGADPKYPVSAIPAELKENVNVVFRHDEMTFQILSESKATFHVRQVITILNDKGKSYASEVVGYDKLSKIREISGSIYDASGKQIRKLKNSEIYDQSAFDGFSLYSDARFKSLDLSHSGYPYTVEFEYVVEYKFLFSIPGFVLIPEEKISVEQSSYNLVFASRNLAPRYKLTNLDTEPTETILQGGAIRWSWSFANVKPIKFEPHGPSREELIVSIAAAPSTFEYDNYFGTMNSWDEFGRWITSLNKGRGVLPEATQKKIKDLTAGVSTNEEKVKILYEYLQNKTRYVSIQLGIGGYQPFEASVVDQTGYGDCKALSNYMVAMLETIGIRSHYALIAAGDGRGRMRTDFPSPQFNHAIVAVPNGKDTLWLECTSQSNPFGYQGRFTGDRKALLITDNGAKVVNTTRYTAGDNSQLRSAEVTLSPTGDAKAIVRTTYSGLQYETDNLDGVVTGGADEQKKWIQDNVEIPNFDIQSFKFANTKNKIPSAEVAIELSLRRFATISGKRIFITPNLMNRSSYIPEKVEARKTGVFTRYAYTDVDTIRYNLPDGIYPEFLPEPVKLMSRFGQYETTFKIDQGSLLYIRKVKMEKGEHPAASYQELIDFYKSINKADHTKIVFLSKT